MLVHFAISLTALLTTVNAAAFDLTPRQSSAQQITLTSGQSYTLTSPKYPSSYGAADASYVFTSPAGTTITMNCPEFNLYCPLLQKPTDYLAVSPSGNVGATSTDAAKNTCSKFTPVTSTGNTLGVTFHGESRSIFAISLTSLRFQCTVTASMAPSTGPCTCGQRGGGTTSTRIVGGQTAQAGEFPWRVLLRIKLSALGGNAVCGGSIISPNWVMTAAHCIKDLSLGWSITAVVGAQQLTGDGVSIAVDRYVTSPNYNSGTFDGDMALLHLKTPVTYSDTVSPICLPWTQVNNDWDNVTAVASGWGTTGVVQVGATNTGSNSNVLLKVDLPVLSTEHCKRQFPNLTYITDNMICTYLPGKDTCQGDSGGSIDTINAKGSYFAIGIVSFGEGCASNDRPGLYSKVTKFLDWVQTTTAGEDYCVV